MELADFKRNLINRETPIQIIIKAGFHACVSSTYNSTRCLSMSGHQCSQAISVFATKACVLATKSHMLNFCKAYATICCDCDLWEPIRRTQKDFLSFEQKIFNSIPNALRDLHTSKYKRPHNKPDKGCIWKPAKRNNVRMSKQLRFVASTKTFHGNQAL